MTEARLHEDYTDMPKTIGTVPADRLLEVATLHIEQFESTPSIHAQSEHAAIAGSAIIEAMLTLEDPTHQSDDYRLESLDVAATYLDITTQLEETILERGYRHPNDYTPWLRAQLNALFIDVYKDMTCGEVTDRTTAEILKQLRAKDRFIGDHLSQQNIPRAASRQLHGLKAEIQVLIDVWKKYAEHGKTIAVPATHRGGSGISRARHTHDVVEFTQNPDTTFTMTRQREVKTEGSVRRKIGQLARYASTLTIVRKDGKIEDM